MLSSRPSTWLPKTLHFAIAAVAVTGIALQFQASLAIFATRGEGVGATLLKLASYFTILTNLLLAVAHGICLLAPRTKIGRFFNLSEVQSGLLLYILVVKIVYVGLLANLWNPEGKQLWADTLLHHVTPLLQFAFWLLALPKRRLPWTLALWWLSYPALYLSWVFVRGAWAADYPYPFINLGNLGLERTLLNSAGMGVTFFTGGLAIIAGSRFLTRGDH